VKSQILFGEGIVADEGVGEEALGLEESVRAVDVVAYSL